jgi:two-component system sensor histidine kinase HydH
MPPTIEDFFAHPPGADDELQGKELERLYWRIKGVLAEHTRQEDFWRATNQTLEEAHKKIIRLEGELLHTENLASIGKMAAGVAHEIGNNLQTIASALRLIKMGATEENNEMSDGIASIKKSLAQAKTILTRLSITSRNDTDAKNLVVKDCLEAVLMILRGHTLESVHIDLHGPAAQTVFFPESIFVQIFMNLLLNALQAMEGVSTQHIVISWQAQTPCVEITISDSGKGITEKERDKIFDAFYTTKAKGTGLGLHLVEKMLQENAGKIALTHLSNPTVFTVTLPKGKIV